MPTGAVAGLCVIFQDRILAGIAALKGKFSLEKHGICDILPVDFPAESWGLIFQQT